MKLRGCNSFGFGVDGTADNCLLFETEAGPSIFIHGSPDGLIAFGKEVIRRAFEQKQAAIVAEVEREQ